MLILLILLILSKKSRRRRLSSYASKDRFDRLLDSGVPAYGHGQVMEYPDLPFLRWSYEYDYSDEFSEGYRYTGIIENSERYTRAFSRIKEYLLDYLNRHPDSISWGNSSWIPAFAGMTK